MVGRDVKDMIEEERLRESKLSQMGVELAGVFVVLGFPSDLGERSKDVLGSGVPLADLV